MDVVCDETDLQGILEGIDDFYETQNNVLSEIGYMEHEHGMSFEIVGEQKDHLLSYQVDINSDPTYSNSFVASKCYEIKGSPESDHGQPIIYSPVLQSFTGSVLGEQLSEMQTSAFLSQVSTTGLPVGPFVIPQEIAAMPSHIAIDHSPKAKDEIFHQEFQQFPAEARQVVGDNIVTEMQRSPQQNSPQDMTRQESIDSNMDLTADGTGANDVYQFIRFQAFQPSSWHGLYDQNFKKLKMLQFRIDADKGFNFSGIDDAFICQKKNHFQLTCLIHLNGEPQFVQTAEGMKKIDRFVLSFFGVKAESVTEIIHLEQSQSDRSKKPFRPIYLDLRSPTISKTTVGRLHFSETTANNMRKKGKPNPDQRFFCLVACLKAECDGQEYTAIAYSSERIIVRASNPGMFESDHPQAWQKGSASDTLFHHGRIGINTDHPEDALVVHGNLRVTGRLVQPSDHRAKEAIQEADTKEQLKNVQALRVVHFKYTDEFAQTAGLKDHERSDTGVIAQEVETIIPDAVRPAGSIVLPSGKELDSFLLVNKERIFMENVGAVKELCKVTDKLETRIDELERMNQKLWMIKRLDNIRSSFNSTCSLTFKKKQRSAFGNVSDGASDQQPSCSSRVIRASVAILVSIMAMCLIAMATLYILEWQKKPFDASYLISGQKQFEIEHHTLLNYSEPSLEDYLYASDKSMQLDEMTEAPNASDYQSSATQKSNIIILPTTPRAILFASKPATVEATPTFSAPQSFTSLTSTKPNPIGRPNACSDITTCQFYCCKVGPRMSNEVESYNSSFSDIEKFLNSQPNTQTEESLFKEYTKEAKGYGSRGPQYDSNSYFMIARLGQQLKKNKRVNQRISRHLTGQLPQSRPSFSLDSITGRGQLSPIPSVSSGTTEWKGRADAISLIGSNFNVTIGPNYCSTDSDEYIGCLNGDATNYTYAIPISKYMPDRSLTLVFNFTTTISLQPDICTSPSKFSVCPDGSTDYTGVNSIQRGLVLSNADMVARTFFVDVGRTSIVAYRLRFPMTRGDTTDLCNKADVNAGEKFIEYNFIFYRVCDD